MVDVLPPPTAPPLLDYGRVETARLRRNARSQLVTESASVTYALLAHARGTTENAARQFVHRSRGRGLITVDYNGTVLIPAFQFDSDYEPINEVLDVSDKLQDTGMSGWAVWRWWHATNSWIDRRPTDLISERDWATLREIANKVSVVS